MARHIARARWVVLMMIFAGAPAWGQNAYITNSGDNTVSVLATANNTVTATIAVGGFPEEVAVTPDGSTAYVANNGSVTVSSTVSVIATATNTVTATIPVGIQPDGVAIAPDGSKVYVANAISGDVSVISAPSNTVIATIPVGNYPGGMVVTPDGGTLYVANALSNTISVIATASETVTATIPIGSQAFAMAVTPDGSSVYVSNSNAVSVIATASNTVTATIPVGKRPVGVAVSPDGSRAYVANYDDDTVSVIATATNTVTDTVRVGAGPWAPIVGPATPATASLVSAILPDSRSVDLSSPATVFATMLNATSNPLSNCYVALPDGAPGALSLSYQTTSATTNAPIGPADTPATIAANGSQSFLLSFTSTAAATLPAFAPAYRCDGAAAATTTGVNTVDLLFSAAPIPDVIALAASTTPGVLTVPFSRQGAAAFAVATDNVGVDGTLTVKTDTGSATLPLVVSLCQTNSQGACLAPPSANVSLDFAAGATPTFSFFVTASGSIPFNPGGARIFVRFLDSTGASHGSTSLAVDTD